MKGLIEDAEELPVFHVRVVLDEAELASPAGRDRALDEVVPVLVAMGESISRDELARVVADRLDADPGLVMRRVAGGEAGPRPRDRAPGRPRPGAMAASGSHRRRRGR